jgi:hypothetical protein
MRIDSLDRVDTNASSSTQIKHRNFVSTRRSRYDAAVTASPVEHAPFVNTTYRAFIVYEDTNRISFRTRPSRIR